MKLVMHPGKKFVATVSFWLAMLTSLWAGDISMVSSVTGSVTASLNEQTWTPVIAETLQTGTTLTIPKDAGISLVHFALNKECEVAGEKKVTLTDAGFDGAKITGTDIAMISGDLDLSARHLENAGAMDPNIPQSSSMGESEEKVNGFNKENGPGKQPPPSPAAAPLSSAKANSNLDTQDNPETNTPSMAFSGYTPPRGDRGSNSFESSLKKDAPLEKGEEASTVMHQKAKSRFALPATICASTWLLKSDSGNDSPVTPHKVPISSGSWLCAELPNSYSPSDEVNRYSIELMRHGKGILLPLMFGDVSSSRQLIRALTHESRGQYEQAAALWLELWEKNNYDKKILEKHLARLERKILKKYHEAKGFK